MQNIINKTYNALATLFLQIKAKVIIHIIANKEDYLIYSKELAYLKQKLSIIPYKLCDLNEELIKVYEEKGLKYSYLDGKKLFFQRNIEMSCAIDTIKNLIMEQQKDSPHLYVDDSFDFPEGAILIDAGAAEGNFALLNIEKAKQVYLFECDNGWNEPLKATFEPYKHKVTIVNKFLVSEKNDNLNEITIDDYFDGISNEKIFIKMDLEGHSIDVLRGAEKCLRNNDCFISTATYHYTDEYKQNKEFLENIGYTVKPGCGYMFPWIFRNMSKPYFRYGILRAWKDNRMSY